MSQHTQEMLARPMGELVDTFDTNSAEFVHVIMNDLAERPDCTMKHLFEISCEGGFVADCLGTPSDSRGFWGEHGPMWVRFRRLSFDEQLAVVQKVEGSWSKKDELTAQSLMLSWMTPPGDSQCRHLLEVLRPALEDREVSQESVAAAILALRLLAVQPANLPYF
jgi:hypothetical protein